MLRLDFYVQHLIRQNASEVLLASGEPVRFRFPDGDRASNVPFDHAQVVQLVQEAAPPAAIDEPPRAAPAAPAVRPAATPAAPAVRSPAAPAPRAPAAPTPTVQAGHAPHAMAAAGAHVDAVPGEPALNHMLRMMIAVSASDLHLSSDVVPLVRRHGEIMPLYDRGPITEREMRDLLFEIAPPRNKEEFAERNDTDFAHMIEDLARFRVNYFMDRKGMGAVMRQIPFDIMSPEKLGIPSKVLDLCHLS